MLEEEFVPHEIPLFHLGARLGACSSRTITPRSASLCTALQIGQSLRLDIEFPCFFGFGFSDARVKTAETEIARLRTMDKTPPLALSIDGIGLDDPKEAS